MTKAEIVNEIAKKTGIEKSVVLTTVESFMETVKTSLINQESVYLRGFGSFIIKHRAEKTARDIHKEKTITIPAGAAQGSGSIIFDDLPRGVYTVTEVAFRAGFESSSYFSAEFRRLEGISPREYKNRLE